MVRVVGLTKDYFPPQLADAFEFALKGDRDRTLRIVQQGGGEIGRLYRLCVQLSHGQALQLARQIRESLDRERTWMKASRAEQPLARTTMGAVPNALAISAERMTAPPTAIMAAPEPASTGVVGKRSGAYRNAVVAFLRDVLAGGPLLVREIERRAIAAGLLELGKSIGDSKVFRTARSQLGVKTFQQSGLKAGGWIWSWPGSGADTLRAAHLGG